MPAKIMIVDDNKDLVVALELRLRANDFETIWAEDGPKAIALAKAENPACVILDLFLPDDDGWLILEKLRALPGVSSLPAIVVTADRSEATRRRALETEACALLEKPVDHHRLLEMLPKLPRQDQVYGGTLTK